MAVIKESNSWLFKSISLKSNFLKSGLGQGFTVQGFNPNRTIVHAESPQLAQEKPGFNGTKLNKQPLNREPGTLNLSYIYLPKNTYRRKVLFVYINGICNIIQSRVGPLIILAPGGSG